MRCPQLTELPAPPPGKTGWPWTEESLTPERFHTATESWPRITVVTPSYNQAAFLEETIRSVLLQGYPNLEYIVMDGGSADTSADILARYGKHLAHWTSARDGGASDAIAKGFERATGSLLAWLNSDDLYLPGTLHHLLEGLRNAAADVVYGDTYWIDKDSSILVERRQTPISRVAYLYGGSDLQQPSMMWTSDVYRRAGGMDSAFRCAFDMDLFARFASKKAKFAHVRRFVACARLQDTQKSVVLAEACREETDLIRKRYNQVPVRSFTGVLLRTFGRMQRLAWYVLQGDLLWLLGRIPDRLKARTSAAQSTGPRSRWY
jgi:glycosyltransferase involved in cell wall biosynthesis